MDSHGSLFTGLLLGCGTVLAFAPSLRASDFNGDGYPDLAVGAYGTDVGGEVSAGAVHVLYGGPTCFETLTSQYITEASFFGNAIPDEYELFGLCVAGGDFDGDGYDDLAIAATGERVGGYSAAGVVYVTYGSALGLDLSRNQSFSQDTKGIKDKAEPGGFFIADLSAETFGRTMVAGDFDGDGFDELALYVGESLGSKKKPKAFAGAVHVLRGSDEGLLVKGNMLIHQDVAGIPGKAVADGKFGWAMAVADLDHDGLDDLAIGAPGNSVKKGTVTILRGSAKKVLTSKKAVVIDEADAGGILDADVGRMFGESLAVGDFAGNGGTQLAIGARTLDVAGVEGAGGVYVVQLSSGLAVTGSQLFTRASPGVDGELIEHAGFGAKLAAGDLDSDGSDDLAVACQGDTVSGVVGAGSISVLAGSASGLSGAGLLVHQDLAGVPDDPELNDFMGDALAAADYDGDGDADLAIGARSEKVGFAHLAGAVLVIEGSTSALLDLSACHWLDESLAGLVGEPGINETFGGSLGL